MSVQRMVAKPNMIILTRSFRLSSIQLAKAPVKKPVGGKTKAKQGFKSKNQAGDGKAKKGGMTHLTFKDAVRQLGFEKGAKELDVKELSNELNLGEIVTYSDANIAKLNLMGSFKKYQHHELFQKPILLVSDNLIKLSNTFVKKFNNETSDKNRLILLGDHRVGKSSLITQVQSLIMSANPNAIFLHFDYPEKIIDGSSDYIFNKKLGVYHQPMLTKRWIMKIREANKEALSQIKLSKDISFTTKKVDYKYKAGENTLYEYLSNCYDFGKMESTTAFEFFINELKLNSEKFPVLLSVDNFNALTTSPFSKYRHPDFTPIHFKEFEIGKFFMDFISGDSKFNGGILLSESSDIGKHDNLSVGLGLKAFDPYQSSKLDVELIEQLNGVVPFNVENLSKENIEELCHFYHDQGILFVRDNYKRNERELGLDLNQIINLNFTRSGGNPGLLLKHVTMSY